MVSEGGGGGDRAVCAWSGRTRDRRARGRRRGMHERTISRRSFLAQNDSPRRGSRNASPRRRNTRSTADRPRDRIEKYRWRTSHRQRATADVTPTVRARSKASRIEFPVADHDARGNDAAPRREKCTRTRRSARCRHAIVERGSHCHLLEIGKNVETRVSRFSRASARVLSLSTQTAAPCTYFNRLKHSKQCDPRRSSRCYSRGDGRHTRTRGMSSSTTLCSQYLFTR